MLRPVGAGLTLAALALLLAACGSDSQPTFATCGNGRIDIGETCDDGNDIDSDACTRICQPARCGDGVRQEGVEACDAADTGNATCLDLGFEGRFPGCTSDCAFDVSRCGPQLPPTATPPATSTVTATFTPAPPTATPTPTLPPCGDGLLGPDETCTSCPQDCTPLPCEPTGGTAKVAVAAAFDGGGALLMRVALAYRTNVLNLPDTSLNARIQPAPGVLLRQPSDNGYQLEVSAGRQPMLMSGEIFTVDFDRCSGAPVPTDADLSCVVTLCNPATAGCSCSAAVRP